ncbi:MAG TPA: hypothetical protein PKW95_20510 [bacterium]|nr:hypothetical protein [bacterium]
MDNWSQIKDNLQSCFCFLTGLSSGAVLWHDPDETMPAAPYLTLRLTEDKGLVRMDQKDEIVLPTRDSGSEQFTVVGRRKFTISCVAHGGDDPSTEPVDLMLQAQLGFCLPAVLEYLKKRQIYTVAVEQANSGEQYQLLIEGVPIAITAASSSPETVRNQLVTAINDCEHIPFKAEAATAVDELTIKSRPGVQFLVELADGETRLTLTDTQAAVDLTYLDDDGVQDVSELVEGVYLERARMDVHFSTIVRTTITLPLIESVEITDMSSGETYLINT